MIDRSLKNTATVPMSSHFDEICGDGVEDELIIFRNKLIQALLYHLVAINTASCRQNTSD